MAPRPPSSSPDQPQERILSLRVRIALAAQLCAAALPAGLIAQRPPSPGGVEIGAHAVGAWTRVDPIPGGGALDEFRIVQPALMAHAAPLPWLAISGIVNLEGLTMEGGELTPGAWGEGFVDRRHPHTYVHELMLTAARRFGGAGVSIAAGKGFVPFGTDDPMSRPILRYPVNHHLAQVLERLVGVAAGRVGPVGAEVALFNGDEPERPGQWPDASRFGDSWAARLTLYPAGGIELQGSHASVKSPEHRAGQGTSQRKWSASVRSERPVGGMPLYFLGEWARTTEAAGTFRFKSLLLEGAWRSRRGRLYYRYERTERPEEQRELDFFRSIRPHLDNSIVGRTRWTLHTVGAGAGVLGGAGAGAVRLEPLVEFTWGRPTSLTPAGFDAEVFYGSDRVWSLTLGARLSLGTPMHRMGRYGVASGGAAAIHMEHPQSRHPERDK